MIPSTAKYIRSVVVVVGDEANATLFHRTPIEFSIRRETSGKPADGHVDLYNLAPETRNQLHTRGERIAIWGGYIRDQNVQIDQNMHLLFQGDIRRVERKTKGTDHISRLYIGGNVAKQTTAVFVKAYEGDISLKQLVSDIIETLDLKPGPLTLIPEDLTLKDVNYSGPSKVALSQYLRAEGLSWYEENGMAKLTYLSEAGTRRDTAKTDITTLSPESGLISAPTVTDTGLRATVLLEPTLNLNSVVRFQSSELPNIPYRITELEHSGNNTLGEFYTQLECRPLMAAGQALSLTDSTASSATRSSLDRDTTYRSATSAMLRFIWDWAKTHIHTFYPAIIKTYDPATHLASAQPAPNVVTRAGESKPRAITFQTPAIFPTGGGFLLYYPFKATDGVFLGVAERGLAPWLEERTLYDPPAGHFWDSRDTVVLGGFLPIDATLHENGEAISMQRTDDSAAVSVTPDAIHAWVEQGQHVFIGGPGGEELATKTFVKNYYNRHRHHTSRGPSGPPFPPAPASPGEDLTKKQRSE